MGQGTESSFGLFFPLNLVSSLTLSLTYKFVGIDEMGNDKIKKDKILVSTKISIDLLTTFRIPDF